MFKCKIGDLDTFKSLIEVVCKLVKEGRMVINKDMIYMNMMTTGLVGMIELKLKNTMFEKYSLEKDITVDFAPEKMIVVARMLDGDTTISITESDMKFSSEKDGVTSNYGLKRMDYGDKIETGQCVTENWDCVFTTKPELLRKPIADAEKLSEQNITFNWDSNGLKLDTEGDVLVNFSIWFSKGKITFTKLGIGSSIFQTRLLKEGIISLTDVMVSVGDQGLIKLDYENPKFKFSYILAPIQPADVRKVSEEKEKEEDKEKVIIKEEKVESE